MVTVRLTLAGMAAAIALLAGGCELVGGPVAASLPALSLPGTRAGPPGDYGWEGRPGDRPDGMHRVVGNHEATAMFFAVGPECLVAGEDRERVPVRIAGFGGVMVEPYEPAFAFAHHGDEITRAHALTIGDRTLCVFVTRHAHTTAAEWAAALRILDTIRAQPVGTDGLRLTFRLLDGWDTG